MFILTVDQLPRTDTSGGGGTGKAVTFVEKYLTPIRSAAEATAFNKPPRRSVAARSLSSFAWHGDGIQVGSFMLPQRSRTSIRSMGFPRSRSAQLLGAAVAGDGDDGQT